MHKIPLPPKFTLAALGPGLVLIALGIGSGEFVLWPALAAQYGLGILWGALLGITCQYFINTESLRYTIATGASTYAGWSRLSRFIPIWFIVSTYMSFVWPGIIGSSGVLLSYVLGIGDPRIPTIIMLLGIGGLLSFGGKVYDNLERVQKWVIFLSIPTLIVIALLVADAADVIPVVKGLAGFGDGYWLFPAGISLSAFLGAIAYAGAGGNLIISSNFYIQDKGYGNASHLDTQIHRHDKAKSLHVGEDFRADAENVANFKKWFKFASLEQLIAFWLIGVVSIIMLAYIAYKLVYPTVVAGNLDFIIAEGALLGGKFGTFVQVLFILIGAVFLFTTQLGIYETTSRIITENLQLFSKRIRGQFARSNIFFSCLWFQILTACGITMLGLQEPIQILLIGTFFSAVSTFALAPLLLWLNNSKLMDRQIRPGFGRNIVLALTAVFFGIFVVLTVLA